MRIANLTHGALYMLGAYIGASTLKVVPNLWLAALIAGAVVAFFGFFLEKLVLRKLAGNVLGQMSAPSASALNSSLYGGGDSRNPQGW